jgi:predicted lipid carrier protein YhbT
MFNQVKSIIFKNAPVVLKPLMAVIPFSVQKKGLEHTLGQLFKEALDDGDFEFLSDRWLKLSVTDLNLVWMISFDGEKLIIEPLGHPARDFDVAFSATGDDLLLIAARKEDPDSLFFQRRLIIEGDTELGLEVKNLIDSVELDALPRYVNSAVNYSAAQIEFNNAKAGI